MKRKSERIYTKMHKISRHNAKNNNSVKFKHLRRNMPFEIQVMPSPHVIAIDVNKREHFANKLMNEDFKLACIIKFLTLLFDKDGKIVTDFSDEILVASLLVHAGEVRHAPTRDLIAGGRS